jgi:hypothetical protein
MNVRFAENLQMSSKFFILNMEFIVKIIELTRSLEQDNEEVKKLFEGIPDEDKKRIQKL